MQCCCLVCFINAICAKREDYFIPPDGFPKLTCTGLALRPFRGSGRVLSDKFAFISPKFSLMVLR